jgi:hypothetical protein
MDRPQEAQYNSEDEVPKDDLLDGGFSPAWVSSPDHGDIDPFAEKQALPEVASHFVAAVALAGQDVVKGTALDMSCSVSQLFHTLQGLLPKECLEQDSLEHLVSRCIEAEQTATCLDFVYMLNCIQLRTRVIG